MGEKILMVHPDLPDADPVSVTEKQLRDVWSKRGWKKKESPKKAKSKATEVAKETDDA